MDAFANCAAEVWEQNFLSVIPLPPYALKLGAYGLILGAAWLHGCHYGEQRISDEYAAYRIQVETAGRAAQTAANEQHARNEKRKAESDASYAKALTVLGGDIERMRRARSGADYLPPAPADSVCPSGWACFDRAELQQAIRQLDEGVSGLLAESDSVKLKLTTAIEWATSK